MNEIDGKREKIFATLMTIIATRRPVNSVGGASAPKDAGRYALQYFSCS
jgi:hypothetical protein